MKPISNFGYSIENNTVAFSDLSLNQPTGWLWDFGDGSQSTDQNPVHIYSQAGIYEVKLITTNDEDDSEPYIEKVRVTEDLNIFIDTTIMELIGHYIPNAISSETSIIEKINLIRKWQMYLQPLVYIPIEVEAKDTFNETKWPGLVKMLIAQLSAYDVILQSANAFVAIATRTSETESEGGGTDPIPIEDLKQQIKSIETGPAKTEWFENKSYLEDSEAMKNLASAFSSATKAGGALDQLKISICQLSQRVRIYLPMCGQLTHSPVVPKVTKAKGHSGHNANPFGITKRML